MSYNNPSVRKYIGIVSRRQLLESSNVENYVDYHMTIAERPCVTALLEYKLILLDHILQRLVFLLRQLH